VLLTRSPLAPKSPFDLHVLGTPPAFILSQDQTLQTCLLLRIGLGLFELGAQKNFWCSHDLRRGTVISSPLTEKLIFIALHDENFKLRSFGQNK
jgi:hypothetical protein